jgi:hypothetical protein
MTTVSKIDVCDDCLDAADDDGVEDDIQDEVMRAMGAEWADHLCDQVESGGEVRCGCGCR